MALLNPKPFNDVKVFAGDKYYPAADASYKNLVWENLPDILFNVDTPAIVSLEYNKNIKVLSRVGWRIDRTDDIRGGIKNKKYLLMENFQ